MEQRAGGWRRGGEEEGEEAEGEELLQSARGYVLAENTGTDSIAAKRREAAVALYL